MNLTFADRLLPAAAVLGAALSAQTVTATPVDTLLRVGPAAYDAGRQQPVMLRQVVVQAGSGVNTRCDLVTWNGADWVPILPPIALTMVAGGLAHDPVRNRLIAFDSNVSLQFVTGQSVALGPVVPYTVYPMFGRRLVHDLARDELVVFGGYHEQQTFPYTVLVFHDETLVLRQGTWQQVNPASRPSARYGYAFVYDLARLRTVLFGGFGSPSGIITPLADTWEWDGISWTQVAASGPAAGASTGTFDATSQRVVVRDGVGDVWSFDGVAWSPVGGGTAPRFSDSILVHDGQRLLMVGGVTTTLQRSRIETWRLEAAGWQLVPTSVHMLNDYNAVMTYDSVRHELLCLNGNWMVSGFNSSTWTWDGVWHEHPGPTPAWGGMAFDEARGEGVLFGGGNLSSPLAETWTWNGTSWTLRTPPQSPPADTFPLLAYDPLRQRVVLASSVGGSWLWDGTTWALAPGPQPPSGSLLVWDPVRAAVVLSGTTGTTWEWTGQWQQVAATAVPQAVYAAAFDPSRGRTFAYTLNAEYEWTGTSWLSRPLPVPMQLQYARAMTTDTNRGRVLFHGVVAPAQGIQLHVLGPTPSLAEDAGGGCPSSMLLVVEQRPAIGDVAVIASAVDPAGVAIFGFAWQPAAIPVGACTLVVDGSAATNWRFPSASGRVDLPLRIPAAPVLRGLALYVQAGTLSAGVPLVSRALRLRVGD